jgi:hypothetical protein
MPKLQYFLPCERVILSKEETLSLITIIDRVNINIPPEDAAQLPEDAAIPTQWSTVTSLEWEPEDLEKQYEQRVYLEMPNGRIATDTVSQIEREADKNRSRVMLQILGFPIAPVGEVSLRLAIREVGKEDWQEIADYTITLSRSDGKN